MLGFLRRLVTGSSRSTKYGPRDGNPVASAGIMGRTDDGPKGSAAAAEREQVREEYEDVLANFQCQPEEKLADLLAAPQNVVLKAWLSWDSEDAEPKAIIRLMREVMERGENFWDLPGISVFLEGRWSQGGGPSPKSDEGLALLSKAIQKPIKLYFCHKPDSEYWVNKYDP